MEQIAFFDTKPYDRTWFDQLNHRFRIRYFEHKLTPDSVSLAQGCSAVIPFVNDNLSAPVIEDLYRFGVKVIALRYSPYAVAEHTMGLLLCLNRKIHKAYNRTRDFNFTLNGLTGFDLHGKTVGVIGTGRIGQIFMNICKGFGMEVLAYDPYPANDPSIHYVDLHTLFQQSDILSLHCPLTEQSKHLINKDTIADMKDGVVLLNTSRGMLIESEALLSALQSGKIAAAGLDVYEEETAFFFEDFSENIHRDQVLSLLLSMPNVLLTSHQAFLTNEALKNIAEVTLQNLADFFDGKPLQNEVKTGQL